MIEEELFTNSPFSVAALHQALVQIGAYRHGSPMPKPCLVIAGAVNSHQVQIALRDTQNVVFMFDDLLESKWSLTLLGPDGYERRITSVGR